MESRRGRGGGERKKEKENRPRMFGRISYTLIRDYGTTPPHTHDTTPPPEPSADGTPVCAGHARAVCEEDESSMG